MDNETLDATAQKIKDNMNERDMFINNICEQIQFLVDLLKTVCVDIDFDKVTYDKDTNFFNFI